MSTDQPTSILDDLARMQEYDTKNMLRLINELPEQCETALSIGRSILPGEPTELPNLVYISGVGDSGTAASMAVAAVSEFVDLPVIDGLGGPLPKFVGENSLVFVLDYVGNSQSAIRVYKEAKQHGAKVICVTSGGTLREMSVANGDLLIRIPPGQSARTAIGYMFMPVVALFEQFGMATGLLEKLSHGIMHMKNVRESLRFENPTTRNIAKQIALGLTDKLILIFGAPDYRSAVACRWKSQLNTNSKTLAFTGFFPEFIEGEISGFEASDNKKSDYCFVFLKDSNDRTEVPALMDTAKGVLDGFQFLDAELKGYSTIEKLLYGVYLADYVSYYLALASGVNPTIVEYVSQAASWGTSDDNESEPIEPDPSAS